VLAAADFGGEDSVAVLGVPRTSTGGDEGRTRLGRQGPGDDDFVRARREQDSRNLGPAGTWGVMLRRREHDVERVGVGWMS